MEAIAMYLSKNSCFLWTQCGIFISSVKGLETINSMASEKEPAECSTNDIVVW
jgi:hypothetical protein